MSGSLLPLAKQIALDNSANPGVGYKFFTYAAGTLTQKATYQDAALTTPNTNPVVANARGEVTMYGSGLYRIILKDASDVTIWDQDNVSGEYAAVKSVMDSLAAPSGASLIGYETEGGDETDVEAVLRDLQTWQGETDRALLSYAPFGLSGMRVAVGELRDAHYGFGGVVAFPSGKWVFIYRKAETHGVSDNSELRAADSYDFGATWENDRLLYQNAAHDARPDAPRLMANNRMGFFVNRQDEGTTHFSPLFFKSDDEGETFSYATIATSSPYTFQAANGGILDFPASQGGSDTQGFITYGYLSAVGLDAFTTVDNGDSWSIVTEVAVPSGAVTSISENVGIRIGNHDKWIFFARAQDSGGWRETLTVFVTTNMLNWGAPRDAGVDLGGNPPGVLYDSTTNKVHLLSFARGNRDINGFENHIMHVAANADALYAANGSFSSLGLSYSILTPVPHWATGYIAPFKYGGKWFATFTCGETGVAGGDKALQVMIGDFAATGADTMKLVSVFMRHQKDVHFLEVVADDNAETSYPLTVSNAAKTAKANYGAYGMNVNLGGAPTYKMVVNGDVLFDIVDAIFGLDDKIPGVTSATLHLGVQGSTYPAAASYTAGTSSRKHYVFHNVNGEVGSISTSGTATAYTTSSDETWKDFIGKYDPLKAIDIIRRDPVREFTWKPERGGGHAVGWGAQTSYAVSPDLATKGGWFKDDVECAPDTEGAVYVPWGVDQSKRTPYLWAAVSHLVDKLTEAEARIAALEANRPK